MHHLGYSSSNRFPDLKLQIALYHDAMTKNTIFDLFFYQNNTGARQLQRDKTGFDDQK